jgi:iron complex transport system substrate-binding protein
MARHRLALAAAVSALAVACGDASPRFATVDPGACVTDFDPELDYYPGKADLRHARNFTLEYHRHYKILRTRSEIGGAEDVIVLNRCGTPEPALTGDLEGALLIDTPVDAFASTSPASALRVRLLGLEDRIAAVPANPYDSVLASLTASGRASRITAHGEPHLEGMLVLGVDALLLWVATVEDAHGLSRAREIGVPAIPLMSWAEPTYLGQIEWIKHHAALFEAEGAAEAWFSDIEERYGELRARAAGLPKIPVVWASPDLPNQWWVEAGNWQDEVLEAAGGRNVFGVDPEQGYLVASTEQLVRVAAEAEVFITNVPSLDALEALLPVESLPAFATGRVFHVHGRVDAERDAYDWYETPLVRPDLLLEDLIAILHPDPEEGPRPGLLAPVVRDPSAR